MYSFAVSHIWKGTVRSILWYRRLGANIVVAVILLLLALNILSLGLFSDILFRDIFPGADPAHKINSFLVYYFLIDFLLRFFFQKNPHLNIESYLTLPVSRRKILSLLILRSSISLFNLFPLLFFIPVAIKLIEPTYGISVAVLWLLSIFSLILTSNFIYFYLDKIQTVKSKFMLAIVSSIAALLIFDYAEIINLTAASMGIFNHLLEITYYTPLPFLIPLFIYELDLRLLRVHTYLDTAMKSGARSEFGAGQFNYLEKFGMIGSYTNLEMKLLLRNKRSRSSYLLAIVTIVFLPLYYFYLLPQLDYYPLPPENVHIGQPQNYNTDYECLVRFEVRADNLPPSTHIYITGDQNQLGPWRPNKLPLKLQSDGSWSRSFIFPKGDSIRCILTLGSWKNEMKEADGDTPDVRSFRVSKDTTFLITNPEWGIPGHDLFVEIILAYFGSLITVILMMVYGQFIFSWESSYFDLMISRPINLREYLMAKIAIMIVSGIIVLVIFIPMVFLSKEIFVLNSAFAVYNIGINTFVLIGWSTLSRKRFDLNAGILSTQGKGGSNFTAIIPAIIIPVVIYVIMASYFSPNTGAAVLTLLGMAGLVFHKQLLKIAILLFHRQKYSMASGFRQK